MIMTEAKKADHDAALDHANIDENLRDASKKTPKKERSEHSRRRIDVPLYLPDRRSIEVEDG